MQNASKAVSARRLAGFVAAAVLAIFGIASIVKGLDGQSTVQSALGQEKVVGTPHMTPDGVAGKAQEAGVQGLALPTCSVADKPIKSGADARCFAEYMRVDALIATRGKTYAEMPRFATEDGKGTNVEAQAQTGPDGRPMNNPARSVWVTATALSTALNTSYMAEQISLFGIGVGAAFLLLGFVIAVFSATGRQKAAGEPEANVAREPVRKRVAA